MVKDSFLYKLELETKLIARILALKLQKKFFQSFLELTFQLFLIFEKYDFLSSIEEISIVKAN